MKKTYHMRVGKNIGKIVLDIAQEFIMNGDPEKSISAYTDNFEGMTKEQAISILKGQNAIIVDDNGNVFMSDNSDALDDVKNYLYDWNEHINTMYNHFYDLLKSRQDTITNFGKYSLDDINNFRLADPVEKYYKSADLDINSIGIHHLAARMMADKLTDNTGYYKWLDVEDHVENDIANTSEYEHILYYAVKYVKIMKYLHKAYMDFNKIYHFLLENTFIQPIPRIEQTMETILFFICRFTDPTTGYYHPLCDEYIAQLKDDMDDDILKTEWGKEYRRYGILEKNIMDGYDAGWLSPEGIYYAANGETNSMIHIQIAEQLFDSNLPVSAQMKKDGVSKHSGNNFPERWLETSGWIKIHNDEIYGCFIGDSKDDEDYPYCPTEKQVEKICDYANKFYNGKFYTLPKIVRKTAPISAYKLRQMDDIMLHEVFNP